MKQMKPLFTYVALIAFFSFMIACSKEGPAGAAGPAGPAGATGSAGPAGPKGDTGTANVIYSDWLDVAYQPDTIHNGAIVDTVSWHVNIAAVKLTNTILNTGEIKVYVNLNTAAQPVIVPLPYFDGAISINPVFFLQTIQLISTDNVSTYTPPSGGSKYQQCRYILIPGGTHGRSAIDWNNYESVKKYLGLKD